MRAILLQKDKYGETGDRLHGRYGLTGKPTLTQTSIAGSLGTSFKAGQTVTLNNLRSLNEKLKEAQNAITGSKQNIEKAGSTIEETEKLGNEAVQILSENLWNKLWDRKITIQDFVAAKFFEDQQNELMAGEPNYPVASISNTLDTAPLPRVCYWDPWFKIQNVKIDSNISDDDLAFLNESYAAELKTSMTLQQMTKIMRNVKQAMIVLNTVSDVLEGILVFASTDSSFAAGTLVTLLFKMAVYLIIMKLIDSILAELMEVKVTGIEGIKGRGNLFYATAPNQFHFQNWVTKVYFEPGMTTIYNAINIACMSIQGIYITAGTLISAGMLLAMSPILWIKAIGVAIREAGVATAKYTGFAEEASMISDAMTVLCYAMAGTTSRAYMTSIVTFLFNTGKGILPSEQYKDTYEDAVEKGITDSGNFSGLVNLPGSFAEYKTTSDLYEIPGVATATSILRTISMVFSTVGYKIFEVFTKSLWVFGAANHRYRGSTDSQNSQITLVDRNMGGISEDSVIHCDTFGLDTPKLQWNYNLPNVKKINAGSWVWGPLKWEIQKDSVKHTSTIRSYSALGVLTELKKANYAAGRAYVDLIQKTTYDNWVYYGFLRFAVNDFHYNKDAKLSLVYERDALYYTGKYKVGSGQLLHAEQVIYNFDFRHDFKWPKTFFTSDRRGRLNYYYCDFADGVRLQYRPVTKAKDNILDGELINTEYEFDDFVYLNQLPLHGTVEGGLDSYLINSNYS